MKRLYKVVDKKGRETYIVCELREEAGLIYSGYLETHDLFIDRTYECERIEHVFPLSSDLLILNGGFN